VHAREVNRKRTGELMIIIYFLKNLVGSARFFGNQPAMPVDRQRIGLACAEQPVADLRGGVQMSQIAPFSGGNAPQRIGIESQRIGIELRQQPADGRAQRAAPFLRPFVGVAQRRKPIRSHVRQERGIRRGGQAVAVDMAENLSVPAKIGIFVGLRIFLHEGDGSVGRENIWRFEINVPVDDERRTVKIRIDGKTFQCSQKRGGRPSFRRAAKNTKIGPAFERGAEEFLQARLVLRDDDRDLLSVPSNMVNEDMLNQRPSPVRQQGGRRHVRYGDVILRHRPCRKND
jgi:hypothetical protein